MFVAINVSFILSTLHFCDERIYREQLVQQPSTFVGQKSTIPTYLLRNFLMVYSRHFLAIESCRKLIQIKIKA